MNAVMHRKTERGKDYICSTFNNSKELVTIFHDSGGIYQQHWQRGNVEYKNKNESFLNDFQENEYEISEFEVGHVTEGIWRPGLCLDIPIALKVNDAEKNRAKNDLKILIDKLHEILLYIEPDSTGLNTHGHKIRELLILACTEIENSWTSYFRLSGNTSERLTTNDYVKLNTKLRLFEYKVTFTNHPIKIEMQPFIDWDENNPTKSLVWYNAYNKTKHNKSDAFALGTLENCLQAISANIILFTVRYGPYEFIEKNDLCANLVREYFKIELENPDIKYFYVPNIVSVSTTSGAFSGPKDSRFEKSWIVDSFTI